MLVTKRKLGLLLLAAIAVVVVAAAVLRQQLFNANPAAPDSNDAKAQEFELKRQRLMAADAELAILKGARDKSFERLEGMRAANKRLPFTFAERDFREEQLTNGRILKEVNAKRAAYELIQLELSQPNAHLDIMKQKVTVAKAELEATIAKKDEAKNRFDSMVMAGSPSPVTHTIEDVREAEHTYDNYVREERERGAAYEQALRELEAFNGI